jgi:hypothetical protein
LLRRPSIQTVSKALATSRKTEPVKLFAEIPGFFNEAGHLQGRAIPRFKTKLFVSLKTAFPYYM